MALSGVAFLGLLVLPGTSLVPGEWRTPVLAAALVAYHLYFSQLYCEAHVGAHVTVLIPPALILLALSPATSPGTTDDATLTVLAAFTCWMMKIVITSAYCGAGVCKLAKSVRSLRNGGHSWCTGSTLQAFIFEAMLLSDKSTHSSFGVPTPFSYPLQKLHLLYPRQLLAPASVGAVAFETLAPLVLLLPAHLSSVPFAMSGLAFHYGIALLQNIDFVSWWGPAYAVFLADPAAWVGGSLFACPPDDLAASITLYSSVATALAAAPWRAALSLTYVAVHLLAVVLLRFWPDVEILPLSSFPMFGEPHNLFDRAKRKWLWLTEKPHATGTLKNYAFPFCRPHTVSVDELHLLPFKYVLFGHGGLDASTGKPQPPKLMSNVRMTPGLEAALDQIRTLGAQAPDTFATDASAAPNLLAALVEAKRAFKETSRTAEPLLDIDATPTTSEALAKSGATSPKPRSTLCRFSRRPLLGLVAWLQAKVLCSSWKPGRCAGTRTGWRGVACSGFAF